MDWEGFPYLFFGLIAVGVIALGIYAYQQEKKRKAALQVLAASLGLQFDPSRNPGLAESFGFLNKLQTGSDRYAECALTGEYQGHSVCCFDYHYETYSTDDKGNRSTEHHWHHLCTLRLPKRFPELTIGPENLFTRAAKVFGYGSIDFESHEFSRAFLVRSPDKKFAYDVCHATMMEYLLANRDLTLEIELDVLALIFPGTSDAESLPRNLDRLVTLRDKLPNYLFDS